jgi:ribonucleoside-diphosphate reductase alpha chain
MHNIESPLTGKEDAFPANPVASGQSTERSNSAESLYSVKRRNGKLTHFDKSKIHVAMTKAFLAVEGSKAAASPRVHETVDRLTDQVFKALIRNHPNGGTFHIEAIQDQVELCLMRFGEQKVARAYVLYREMRNQARHNEVAVEELDSDCEECVLHVTLKDGSKVPLDSSRLKMVVSEACSGLSGVSEDKVLNETINSLFDGVPEKDVAPTLLMSARSLIDKDPAYSQVAARLLLDNMRSEALSFLSGKLTHATHSQMAEGYAEYFANYIKKAAELELLDTELTRYDLKKLGQAIDAQRDFNFTYLGLQTLYDRYFIHSNLVRFELPQAFFMRVAMGLAINEVDREEKAIEFYSLLSSFDFMSSTPTLFNSGTLRPQLSSCYLTTVPVMSS